MQRSPLPALVTSSARRKLLTELFGTGRHDSVRGLARDLGLSYQAAHRELNRLAAAGLLSKRRVGNATVFGPDPSSPYAATLAEWAVADHPARPGFDLDPRTVRRRLNRNAAVAQFGRSLRDAYAGRHATH